MMMQECLLLPRVCAARVDQSVCKRASQDSKHSIASAQIICKQTTFTEHGKASLHCQPFTLFNLFQNLNPYQVEPSRSDRSLCERESKKDPRVFEGNKIEKGHLRIESLNEEHDTFAWFVHLQVNVCPISYFKKLILGVSVLACPSKNLALLRRIRGLQQD